MFPIFSLQSALEIWKDRFCKTAYTSCERFKRSGSAQPVPNNLLPNGSLLRRSGSPPSR